MKMLICNIRHEKLEEVREKLFELGIPGMTVSEVKGIGKPMHQLKSEAHSAPARIPQFHPRVELKIVLDDGEVHEVVKTIISTVKTGNMGDGKIFICPVEEAIRIRTEEKGNQALY